MLLPRSISKFIAVLRGNVAPPLIFLSVLLGIWTGMMPGWSGLHTVLVVLVLLINVHIGLFMLSLMVGKALSLAAAPALYYLGVWVQGHMSWMLATLAATPILGMADYRVYALDGALLVGPVVGAIAGLALAFIVFNFRRVMVKLDDKSEKFRKYYSKFWVRLLDWFIIGKRTKDVKSMFAKAKFIRKAGVVLAVILVGGFLVAAHFLQGTALKGYAVNALTQINGAEADINDVGISLLGGNARVTGVQLTDPNNPQQNHLAIERAEAQTNMYELLLGRLVVEKMELTQVRFSGARQTPGTVLPKPPEEEKPFDANSYKVDAGDLAKLDKYVKDAKKLKEQLGKLRNWLPDSNQPAGEQAAEEKKPDTYLGYLDAKSQTPPTPKMLAKLLLADKTQIPSTLFGNSKVEITNLSDAPQAAKLPIALEMKSYETPALLKLVMDYSKGGTPEVSGTFEGLDLGKLQSESSGDTGLAFKSGLAGGTFTGTLTKDQVDLSINVGLKDLVAQGTGKGVLGLGAEQTTQALQALKELTTTIRVVGPLSDPRLVFDTKGLTKEFQDALVKAGKDRALSEVNKQLEKQLGDKVAPELKESLKKPGGDVLNNLGGLLGGKKKQDEKK